MKDSPSSLYHKLYYAAAAATAIVMLSSAANVAAQTGIAATKHNLGTTGTQTIHTTAGTAEICVFCHTPHGGQVGNAPLWNKNLPLGTTFTTYATNNSTTLDGETLTVGSVSLACLSCHDGAQALDNIINAPGSGGYDPTGGGVDGLAYTWVGAGGPNADKMPAGITNIGKDLTNDHPIGIEYCGGGLSGTTANATPNVATGTCNDTGFFQPWSAVINSQPVWWVESGTSDSKRTRSDLVLYTRTFAAGTGPSVECASCHDPHVQEGQTAPNSMVSGKTFLRISNDGSALCLTCHDK